MNSLDRHDSVVVLSGSKLVAVEAAPQYEMRWVRSGLVIADSRPPNPAPPQGNSREMNGRVGVLVLAHVLLRAAGLVDDNRRLQRLGQSAELVE